MLTKLYCLFAFISVICIQTVKSHGHSNSSDSALDEAHVVAAQIWAKTKHLRSDLSDMREIGEFDDEKLISAANTIATIAGNNLEKAPVGVQTEIQALLKNIKDQLKEMEKSGKFDPKVVQSLDRVAQIAFKASKPTPSTAASAKP